MDPYHDHKLFRTIQNYWIHPTWLHKRMLFISGPRQVGKTTLVQATLCPGQKGYFNWDDRKIRRVYQKDPDFFSGSDNQWICFDEIHKRPKWKDILKGIYDGNKGNFNFVITGSARLDTFKKSGDSLVGRYFHTHLFPMNIPDLSHTNFTLPKNPVELISRSKDLNDVSYDALLNLGGFPEPFFSGKESFWKRWSRSHRELILTEDLRDLTKVIEVDKIGLLFEMLIPSVGSLVSNNSLARDLETTHASVKRWLAILNRLQLVFPVSPYSKNIRRSYKQEKKWYLTDWCAAKTNLFENFVAASLYRAVTLYEDRYGDEMSLHFVRTHDGAGVDFLICRDKKPWLLVEAKAGSVDFKKSVYRFANELNVPCVVVTQKKGIYQVRKSHGGQKIFCLSWSRLAQVLP